MPKRAVPLITGQIYHVYNRGIDKRPIFLSKPHYSRAYQTLEYYQYESIPVKFSYFLRKSVSDRRQIFASFSSQDKIVEIIAYCLMPNHFHLCLKQLKEGGISHYLSQFQNSYTRYCNTTTQRIGQLLGDEFKSVHVEDEDQLLHLTRYIHLNPYTSYLIKQKSELFQYPWSSIGQYITGDSGICDPSLVLSNMSKDMYSDFVNDQADYQRELDRISHLTIDGYP